MMTENKVTGKKIATDFIVLARDVGVYLAQLGKTVYTKLKAAFDASKEQSRCDSDKQIA